MSRPSAKPEPAAATDRRPVFGVDWVVFRCAFGPRLSIREAVAVARQLRRVLQRYAQDPVPEIISGHLPGGAPGVRPHLAVVALPRVGGHENVGELVGLALVLPRTATGDERRAVLDAVETWEASARRDDEAAPTLPLMLGSLGVLALERVRPDRPQRSLQPASWCGPALRWASATPIVLDRFPGKLYSRDRAAVARATERAQETIARSCGYIQLPEPSEVRIIRGSGLRGFPPASEFPPYPGTAGRQVRFAVHATVTFAEPVYGPVLLGAGRHEGLGLMRPIPSHAGQERPSAPVNASPASGTARTPPRPVATRPRSGRR